jgi:hypothetical protein
VQLRLELLFAGLGSTKSILSPRESSLGSVGLGLVGITFLNQVQYFHHGGSHLLLLVLIINNLAFGPQLTAVVNEATRSSGCGIWLNWLWWIWRGDLAALALSHRPNRLCAPFPPFNYWDSDVSYIFLNQFRDDG